MRIRIKECINTSWTEWRNNISFNNLKTSCPENILKCFFFLSNIASTTTRIQLPTFQANHYHRASHMIIPPKNLLVFWHTSQSILSSPLWHRARWTCRSFKPQMSNISCAIIIRTSRIGIDGSLYRLFFYRQDSFGLKWSSIIRGKYITHKKENTHTHTHGQHRGTSALFCERQQITMAVGRRE